MINWKPTVTALNAKANAGSPLPDVCRQLARDIQTVGKTYDHVWHFKPIATTLVESSAHAMWRVSSADSIHKTNDLAALVDGQPVPPADPDADLHAAWAAATARAQKAVKSAGDDVPHVLVLASKAGLPPEPRQYIDEYYRVGVVNNRDFPGGPTAYRGDVELRLTEFLAEAASLLA